MSARKITIVVTPAQARMINSALAREEAEEHEEGDGYVHAVMDRTRQKVWDAMVAAGVEP